MNETPWSTASAGLSLPLRLAWVLAREDGRPPAEVGGPGPLLLGAAVLQLLHDGALVRRGGGYARGDADAGDPFEAWVRDVLPAGRSGDGEPGSGDDGRRGSGGDGRRGSGGVGRRGSGGHGQPGSGGRGESPEAGAEVVAAGDRQLEELAADVAGRAGHRATLALEELGLLVRVPRRVLGLPLGRSLRVADRGALAADRALVRAVLDGAETHDIAMGALVAYLHHGGLVAHLEPADVHAAETRAARIAGDDPDAPSPQGPVAKAVRRTVEAMHVVLVPVGAIQVVTTTAHHRR